MTRWMLTPLALVGLLAGCGKAPDATGTTMDVPVRYEPWRGEGFAGRQLVTEHYRIYTTSSHHAILTSLPGFLEAAHRNYLQVTGLPERPAGEPMPVYMMGTRQEWVALTRSIVGPQIDTYLGIEAGGYCYKGVCVFWDSGGVGSFSTAAHEGLHQFLGHRLKDQLPMWMEEGLAVVSEGFQMDGSAVRFTPHGNVGRLTNLRRAIVQGWWIPLAKLLPMDGGDAVELGFTEKVVGYYGQVWALAEFLRSDPEYAQRRARMLADAEAGLFHKALDVTPAEYARLRRQGRGYNRIVSAPLFKYYITQDLPGFEKRWKAFAERLVKLQ